MTWHLVKAGLQLNCEQRDNQWPWKKNYTILKLDQGKKNRRTIWRNWTGHFLVKQIWFVRSYINFGLRKRHELASTKTSHFFCTQHFSLSTRWIVFQKLPSHKDVVKLWNIFADWWPLAPDEVNKTGEQKESTQGKGSNSTHHG